MAFRTDPSLSVAILGDKSCIYCGENLKGLSAQEKCPKCGRLAGYSLLGDHLRDVDSGWIRTVMRGIALVTIGYAALAVIGAVRLGMLAGPRSLATDLAVVRYCLLLAAWVVFAVGVMLMTAPETSGSLIARRRAIPITLRLSTIFAAALTFVPENWLGTQPPVYTVIYQAAISLATVLCHSFLWVYLRKIIDRTPRREVGRLLFYAFCVTLPLYLLASRSAMQLLATQYLSESATQKVRIIIVVLLILHHLAAIYPLQLTGKAIRRTVGYWS